VFRVRRAVESDLPHVFAIYDDEVLHGTSAFDEVPFTTEQREAWLAKHRDERYPALIAEDAEHVLSWGTLSPWSPEVVFAASAEAVVHVHKRAGIDGVGRRMLQELIAHARAVELSALVARVCSENQASLTLHSELGFRRIGTLRNVAKKFGRSLHVELLELELS
jgi:phosphinothricin acetyltransferase